MSHPSFNFSQALLGWFDIHGRKHLPWQHPITPYRVWLSEIMLQQTQVDTVIPYFLRFLEHFPNVEALASAPQDEVLHLWTGLGYYARARNLHKCAQMLTAEHQGKFPDDVEKLGKLPGIGPSTAAAITSIAFEQSTAILDGNVKRVLARFHAVEGWPGNSKVADNLWQYAHKHMPPKRCRDYTQAIMDLGATLCTRSKPKCTECPMAKKCKAYKQNKVLDFPGKKPKKDKPTKETQMLLILNTDGGIFLEQRPQTGIWGGLWSLPELEMSDNVEEYVLNRFGECLSVRQHEHIKHIFSHYTLLIHPVSVQLKSPVNTISDTGKVWYSKKVPQKLGLAAPVKKLLHSLD